MRCALVVPPRGASKLGKGGLCRVLPEKHDGGPQCRDPAPNPRALDPLSWIGRCGLRSRPVAVEKLDFGFRPCCHKEGIRPCESQETRGGGLVQMTWI